MSQLDQQGWAAAISSIREHVPGTKFRNWIEPLRLIRSDQGRVVLGVPNQFHGEWLKSNYQDKLYEAISKQIGSSVQLEFELLPEGRQQESLPIQNANADANKTAPQNAPERAPLHVVGAEGSAAPAVAQHPPEPVQPEPTPIEKPKTNQHPLPPLNHPFFEAGYNRLAYQCSQMFAKDANPAINPLILVGGVGMGRTHLLAEIGQVIQQTTPALRVRYVSADNFTNEMYQSFQNKTAIEFKRRFTDETDVLLFDDVHLLETRKASQENLLHIFNEITSRGGRIAFTSLVNPSQLTGLIEPLRSRLLSGVIADIKQPTHEQRVELLSKKCAVDGILLDGPVLRSLAAKGQQDIRELMGSLIRLHLKATLENRPIDELDVNKDAYVSPAKRQTITLDEIIALVESNFGVSRDDLVSKSRKSNIAWARQVAMYLARHYTQMSLHQIGKPFDRDHATVIHASSKVDKAMKEIPPKKFEVEYLKTKLRARIEGED